MDVEKPNMVLENLYMDIENPYEDFENTYMDLDHPYMDIENPCMDFENLDLNALPPMQEAPKCVPECSRSRTSCRVPRCEPRATPECPGPGDSGYI